MPMIFAGLLLNDKDILARANAKEHFIFQEDHQTWIVGQSDVGRKLHSADDRPREPYTSEDVGIAEWGEQHTKQPERDGRNWDAPYRRNVGSSTLAHALVARLMGAEEIWNWPPFFAYIDRYWEMEKETLREQTLSNPFTAPFGKPTDPINNLRTQMQLFRIDQKLVSSPLADIPSEVFRALDSLGIKPPRGRVAITAGSRGIANIAQITTAAGQWLRAHGAEPFLVPCMGSHNGATAEGQRE